MRLYHYSVGKLANFHDIMNRFYTSIKLEQNLFLPKVLVLCSLVLCGQADKVSELIWSTQLKVNTVETIARRDFIKIRTTQKDEPLNAGPECACRKIWRLIYSQKTGFTLVSAAVSLQSSHKIVRFSSKAALELMSHFLL